MVVQNISFFHETIYWWDVVFSNNIYLKDDQKNFLTIAAELLPNDPFDSKTWEQWTLKIHKKTGKNGKDLYMPLRVALTGKNHGPELKLLMPLLNRNQVLKKLGF